MLILPYKLDISLYRIPLLTAVVCLICVVTFTTQLSSNSEYAQRITSYCAKELDPNLAAILNGASADGVNGGCIANFLAIRDSDDRDATIATLAKGVREPKFYPDKAQDLEYKTAKLSHGFADFDLSVPKQLTEDLAYNPGQWNVVRMMTSTFAHGSWSHLLGNLFFFFIFASFVESAVGYLYFVLAFVVIAISTNVAYSFSVPDVGALPTIGLSGVVMGMMALITALMPTARVKVFFWFLLFIRRFTLPLGVIAAWYVGWDLFDLLRDDGTSRVNYMAHVSGAITGLVLGVLFRLFHGERMRTIEAEMAG